jgi:hypothetical protein
MESSLLGRDVRFGRGDRQPRAYGFMVGDNCEIGILLPSADGRVVAGDVGAARRRSR